MRLLDFSLLLIVPIASGVVFTCLDDCVCSTTAENVVCPSGNRTELQVKQKEDRLRGFHTIAISGNNLTRLPAEEKLLESFPDVLTIDVSNNTDFDCDSLFEYAKITVVSDCVTINASDPSDETRYISKAEFLNLTKELTGVRDELKNCTSNEQFANLTAEFSDMRELLNVSNFTRIKDFMNLTEEVAGVQEDMKRLARDANNAFVNVRKEIDDLKEDLKKYPSRNEFSSLAGELRNMKKDFKDCPGASDFSDMKEKLKDLKDDVKKAPSKDDFKELKEKVKDLKEDLKKLPSKSDFKDLKKDFDDFKDSIKKKVSEMEKKLSKIK